MTSPWYDYPIWDMPIWTSAGSVFSFLSLVAAVVIAVILHNAADASSKASTLISEQLRELAQRSRRDEIYRQLRDSRDPAMLQMLVVEGRGMSTGSERTTLEKYYYANPCSPPLGSRSSLPPDLSPEASREVVRAVLDSLPARYAAMRSPDPSFINDMARLTRECIDLKVPTYPIADFIASRCREDWVILDRKIRDILAPPIGFSGRESNIEAAEDYLKHLRRSMPKANFVNILAGVCYAIIDCQDHTKQPQFGYPIQSAFASMFKTVPGQLQDDSHDSDMTIRVNHCIGLMVQAIGVVAHDPYLTKCCMEGITAVLTAFKGRFLTAGMATEALTTGITALAPKPNDNNHGVRQNFLWAAQRAVPGLDVHVAGRGTSD